MKEKTVKQYICDYCGKKNYSKGHMNKHEKHCTMNPNRICGVCKNEGVEQPKIEYLIKIMPKMKSYFHDEFGYETIENKNELKQAFPKLEEAENNCYMCIFAALRQAGIHPNIVFDYKKRSQEYWCFYNEEQEIHNF